MLSSEPGITSMDYWMYFDFVCWTLLDGCIITRKTPKSHRNTENIKNRLDETHVVPSPVPHTETHKFATLRFARLRSAAFSVQPANENHEKGDRGGGKNIFSIFGVREVTAG